MKGKLITINNQWWVSSYELHKYNYPQEIEVLDYPRNLILKKGEDVEFEAISIEDYVGFAGHTAYPTFTTKARLFEIKEEVMYQFDDRFYSDIYDVIDYMYTNNNMELSQEDIIGQKLTICRKEQAISNGTISKMQDILYNREEERFDENDYLENRLNKIWDSLKAIEMFYPSTEDYVITEKDMNDYLS